MTGTKNIEHFVTEKCFGNHFVNFVNNTEDYLLGGEVTKILHPKTYQTSDCNFNAQNAGFLADLSKKTTLQLATTRIIAHKREAVNKRCEPYHHDLTMLR